MNERLALGYTASIHELFRKNTVIHSLTRLEGGSQIISVTNNDPKFITLNPFNHLVPAVVIVLGGEIKVSRNHQPNHDKARRKTRSERNPRKRR
jgi:hypothetical protein